MLDTEIRQKIADYLASEITLQDFQTWFVSSTWDMPALDNPRLIRVIGKVELWLAEFSIDHLTEDEMQYEMRQFLNEPIKITGGSSAQIVYSSFLSDSPSITWQHVAISNAEELV